MEIFSLDLLCYPFAMPFTGYIAASKRSEKIGWLVSHCHTCSEREIYVDELSKYIDVNIEGNLKHIYVVLRK